MKRRQQAHHDHVARPEGELQRVRDWQSIVTLALSAFNVAV